MNDDKIIYFGHITAPIHNMHEIKNRLIYNGITVSPRYSNDNWYTLVFPLETSTELIGENLFKITVPSGFSFTYAPPKLQNKGILEDEYSRVPQITFDV